MPIGASASPFFLLGAGLRGTLLLTFPGFFSLGMDRLIRWLNPKVV